MTSLLPLLLQLWRDNGETDISNKAGLGGVAHSMLLPLEVHKE